MTLPKYFTEGKKHKKSKQQESRVAKAMGGKRQKGSGSQSFHKGDVKSIEMLLECKRTDCESMSVKKEWLVKIWKEAVFYNKNPALSIEFDSMPGVVPRDWVAIPVELLNKLIKAYAFLMEQDDGDDS